MAADGGGRALLQARGEARDLLRALVEAPAALGHALPLRLWQKSASTGRWLHHWLHSGLQSVLHRWMQRWMQRRLLLVSSLLRSVT